MSRSAAPAVVLAMALLAGAGPGSCAGQPEVVVRSLGAASQCGGTGDRPSARRLLTAAEVAAALSPWLGAAPAAPAVSWASEAVVLVSGGQRTSAGYGIELVSTRAQVKDGAAALRVAFTSPPAGAVTAQVMTSPCLVVALPSEGLRAVAVLDGERVAATVMLE